MKQRLLKTIGLTLLCVVGASKAWADNSKTITVKDQTTVNGSTVVRTDEVTVAYTNADNAIWYLGDYDLSSISSIDVIGAAFASKGDGTKAELKLAWKEVSSIGEVDASYLSNNSSDIRSAGKMLAKIVAETTPTTIASGKDATHYAGADFNITSNAVTKTGTYDGTVSEGTHQAINKVSGIVHLFVYGTASSRRLAVNQIKINFAGTGVYNKTTNVEFSKINDAFNYLTDADTELEVNSDQTLTGRCTWSNAHTLTITPKKTITIKGPSNAMWFLTNTNNATLKIGSKGYKIIFDGESSNHISDNAHITRRENTTNLYLTNIVFKDFTLGANSLIGCKNSGNAIYLEDIALTNCQTTGNALIDNLREANDAVYLKGFLNVSNCTGATIYTKNRIRLGDPEGTSIYNDFTASNVITINWGNIANNGDLLVVKVPGSQEDKFAVTDANFCFVRTASNGDMKLAQFYTLPVSSAGAATLVLPFEATIPTGVKAYTLNYTAGKSSVKATEVTTTLNANTPVLVNATEGSYKWVSSATSGDAATGSGQVTVGALVGNYDADFYCPADDYILGSGTDGVAFYHPNSTNTNMVPTNRAYLHADGAGARLSISFGDEETAISDIQAEQQAEGYYNLRGQRVENPTKGLYIVNGKKVIIK